MTEKSDDGHEEKSHARIDNDPDKRLKKIKKNIRRNPWVLSTLIFGILFIILLVGNIFGFPDFFSNRGSISGEVAGGKIVEFLNGRTGGGVKYISYDDLGSLYAVTVSYQDQQVPVFVTKDGEYFVQGAVPISGASDDPTATDGQPTQQPPEDVPKSDKPVVELFVMSHCPYGTQSEKGIIPVFELLGDKIDSEIRFVYYAMHGETEVKEQLNQYCIQKEEEDKYLDYLKCFLEAGDGESCLSKAKIDSAKLSKCTKSADEQFDIIENLENKSSWLNGRFPQFNTDKQLNEEYGVGGSPALVINGQSVGSGRDSASYLLVICNAFNEPPEECNEELSSEPPSPGFGYNTASGGSDSDAQCG